jgi:hypothetical protein
LQVPAGDDAMFTGELEPATVFGDAGNNTLLVQTRSVVAFSGGDGVDLFHTLPFSNAAMTVTGGNDSGDAADTIHIGAGDDLVFGNGGNDQPAPRHHRRHRQHRDEQLHLIGGRYITARARQRGGEDTRPRSR